VTIEITTPRNGSYMTVLRQIDGTKVVYKAYQQRIGKLGSNSDEDQMYFVLHFLQPMPEYYLKRQTLKNPHPCLNSHFTPHSD
jgi:hypothetical protein